MPKMYRWGRTCGLANAFLTKTGDTTVFAERIIVLSKDPVA
jgi:hypothetical protein